MISLKNNVGKRWKLNGSFTVAVANAGISLQPMAKKFLDS
jgi:hypothetical protein